MFEIQAAPLTPLDRIVIGHDDSGSGPGWKLSKVTVECPSAGLCQTFLCDKWLARDEGKGGYSKLFFVYLSLVSL